MSLNGDITWALNSGVECLPYTQIVSGSIPLEPTIFKALLEGGISSTHPLKSGTKAIGYRMKQLYYEPPLQGCVELVQVRHGVGQQKPTLSKLTGIKTTQLTLLLQRSV